MSRWFRSYDDALDDPKVQTLSDALFRAWFNLMCVSSKNDGNSFDLAEVAFRLRVKPAKAQAIITSLIAAGLIDMDGTRYISHNWATRQFKSDVSNERVKRYRERHCNVTDAVTVTPPETEQIQTTERIDSFKKVGKVVKEGYKPPKHGAFSKTSGRVYFHAGTPEWEAHAADFVNARQTLPVPDKGGGFWFKMRGEAA